MYYPIFRGKQYEFITIRESISKLKRSGKIVPVIEPVKNGKSSINSLYKCLSDLHDASLESIFIVNPRCMKGDFHKKKNDLITIIEHIKTNFPQVSFGYWIGMETNDLDLFDFIKNNTSNFYLLHYSEYPNFQKILDSSGVENQFQGHFLDVDSLSQSYIDTIKSKRILLKDNFIRSEVNEEYRFEKDEFFSNDYLNFKEKAYQGFADYLVIGSKYEVGGQTPETVAIHITYEMNNKSCIRVRHCLSKHYLVNKDSGKMIREALIELKVFLNDKPEILTYSKACIELMACLSNEQKNTSLANIKKLSMNHHLELMVEVLEDKDNTNLN
ncbi:sce7725 family protein [Acinetobacter bereziniae]|uniref:sce7725 family protein n=1 Tax=Acinetobacter bereziniae TaxID=106648 RepID=UPI002577CC2E|nr:sce7725 family protein [Acinetobacter bereziniae]MDM1783141.1 sce7725 family protein [Acinetobacter bereziniae]